MAPRTLASNEFSIEGKVTRLKHGINKSGEPYCQFDVAGISWWLPKELWAEADRFDVGNRVVVKGEHMGSVNYKPILEITEILLSPSDPINLGNIPTGVGAGTNGNGVHSKGQPA